MSVPMRIVNCLALALLILVTPLSATDVWSGPAFSVDPAALRQAAAAVKAEKQSEATVLLNELHFTFDVAGGLIEERHLIYRVENQQGVENWAETSGRWKAWHQAKPEIKARVITSDGAVHWLDPKTLSDVPVHENPPDLYSDERRYGGPLPAVAPEAIVEEEVIIRDTAPLFAAGTVDRRTLQWGVPVNQTRVAVTHPESTPFHYQVHLLPEATVRKSMAQGMETITFEQGPLAADTETLEHLPPDLVLSPEIEFSTGTSWQQVASEYARLSDEKLRAADMQSLMAKVDIKNGARGDKISRIVAALHKNVRYTGVEFGESSLIPQFPSETLKRKYGDCKDKATLLVAMLRSAGIPANLALLETGPGRDINAELPGMGMFDHAIVYVPASGTDSDLWIDATAQYSQVGTLPWMDYGRSALVVSQKTDSLKHIPDLTAAQNVHREIREFTLSEYGTAKIVETDEEIGPGDADYRDYYSGDVKQIKEASDNYVKEAYLADSLTSLEHGDLSDLQKPASIRFVTKGKRGNTDLTTALAAIRVEALFDRLPGYFRTKEKEPTPDAAASDAPKPRTADWWITPYVTEWQYKVTAPLGFKLRALPSDRSDQIGPLNFTQKYTANPGGTVVEAVLRVENPASRLTVQQAKDLRDAVVKARDGDVIFITFDHVGHSLISSGKIKEGLESYRQVAAQHPKEALHKVQLAQALLTAGLAEQARSVALEAITLEPKSALAFSTQGMILKHDLIGRPLRKGMDQAGAIAAYRNSIALDPKDKDTRAALALLLEYDAEGIRYSKNAPLKEAVAELHELKKLDEEYSRSYDDNVLYDLWYAHDFKGVLDYATTLPTSDARRGLTLAAIAVLQGPDAALKKSLEITTDDQVRSKDLVTAAAVLVRVRKYAEAAALYAEGGRGQSNESQLTRSAAIFSKTRPWDEIKMESSDPRSVVHRLYGTMLGGDLTLAAFKSLVYRDPLDPPDPDEEKQFPVAMSRINSQMRDTGLPLITLADTAVSNMHYTVEGDDTLGYKITVESPGAPAHDLYIIREGANYKVAGFSMADTIIPEDLAFLALREIEKNNLTAARTWLDRARDKIHASGGDDPLAGNPFPQFWTKGQEADLNTIRTAALVLLPSKALKGPYFVALDKARAAAKSDAERNRLTMTLAYAQSAQEHWEEMLPLTDELRKAVPTSARAFDLSATAYRGLKRFDAWETLAQERMQKFPDELGYVRSASRAAAYRGDFAKTRELLHRIIDKGQATSSDLNLFAWYALFLSSPIRPDAIEAAERANELTKNGNFSILHTLACIYADSGKASRARELLLKAMDVQHDDEPTSEIWLGLGLVAEQYGALAPSQTMYSRVEKQKIEYPDSSYALAQQHLAAMHTGSDTTSKSSGH